MRVLTLIQLSAAALFPLGLLLPQGPNSGANTTDRPTTKPTPPDADTSTSRSTQAESPAPPAVESIASPERFPTAPISVATPTEQLPLVQVPALPPAGQATQPSTPKPAHKSVGISPPELSRMPWDRIIERSTGVKLGQMTAAVSSKALLANASLNPNPRPLPVADRNPQPSDSSIQAVTPSPAVKATAEATVQAAVQAAAEATAPVTLPPPAVLVAANPAASPPSAPVSDIPGGLLQQSAVVAAASVAPPAATASPTAVPSTATPSTASSTATPSITTPSITTSSTVAPPSPVAQKTTGIAQRPTSPGLAPAPNATPISPTVADPSYTLGVGDQLQITFFNVPEYSGNYQVLVDGSLNMPMVGAVSVTGLTLRQAEATITSRYSAELSNPQVTISLLQARPVQIGVVGEVGQPGFYMLNPAEGVPSVVQAVRAAGGATQTADLRQVEVRRARGGAGSQTITVNLWDLLQNGNLAQNVSLRDGDTIMIRAAAEANPLESTQLAASNLATTNQVLDVALVGEVIRPGAYKLGSEGSRPTLTQAIQTAGGVTPLADIRQVEVRRMTRSGSEQVLKVNLWQLVQSGDLNQDVILQQGDRITIATAKALTAEESVRLSATNIAQNSIKVTVVGEVASAGSIEVPGNTTLSQAILNAGGLTRRAARTVKLIRMSPNGTLTQEEIKFDTAQGIDPEENPLLRNNDIIVVRRTGFAQFSDTLDDVLAPIFRVLPLTNMLF